MWAAPLKPIRKRDYGFLVVSLAGAAIAVVSFLAESIAAGAATAGAGAAAGAAAAGSTFAVSDLAPQAARANMAANVAIRFIEFLVGYPR